MLAVRTGRTGIGLLAALLIFQGAAWARSDLPLRRRAALRGANFSARASRWEGPELFAGAGFTGGEEEKAGASDAQPPSPALLALQNPQTPQPEARHASTLHARMAVMRVLTEGNLPSLGSPSAPVKMVIFSDFECPYCRKLMDILQHEVLPGHGQQVQVLYRFFPLTNHPWALTAAEEAGCAAMQGNDEFWALHNQIFENQKTINKQNAQSRIMELAKAVPGINFAAFQSCVEKQASLKKVLRDMSLGNLANIYATPTLFVNGWRLDGVATASELKEVIGYALEDSQSGSVSQESGAKSGGKSK